MNTKLNLVATQLNTSTIEAECFIKQVNQYLPRRMAYAAITKAIRSLPIPDRKPTNVANILAREYQFSTTKLPQVRETPVAPVRAAPIEEKVYNVRVVGVTFDGRQSVVASLKPGQPVFLRREPANAFDKNATQVVNQAGLQIGFLDRMLASSLAPQLDALKCMVAGTVVSITGYTKGSLGVLIQFSLPIPTQEYATEGTNL